MSVLDLPIDRSVDIGANAASYKNPARVRIASTTPIPGWDIYFGISPEKWWRIGEMRFDQHGTTALVFGVGGTDSDLGVNFSLAVHSKRLGMHVSSGEIHDADAFFVFGVSPDETKRSRIFHASNDKYVPASGNTGPPWQLQPWGVPRKMPGKRGIFDRGITDHLTAVVIPTPPEPEPTPMPESLLETVREERARYGTPLSNTEMGALVNAVAWRHRDDGWKVAAKDVGAMTIQPRTGISISRDILIHEPSKQMWDVLSDVAGAAAPVWGDPMVQDMVAVAPVRPMGAPEEPDEGDDGGSGPIVPPPGADKLVAAMKGFLTDVRNAADDALEMMGD